MSKVDQINKSENPTAGQIPSGIDNLNEKAECKIAEDSVQELMNEQDGDQRPTPIATPCLTPLNEDPPNSPPNFQDSQQDIDLTQHNQSGPTVTVAGNTANYASNNGNNMKDFHDSDSSRDFSPHANNASLFVNGNNQDLNQNNENNIDNNPIPSNMFTFDNLKKHNILNNDNSENNAPTSKTQQLIDIILCIRGISKPRSAKEHNNIVHEAHSLRNILSKPNAFVTKDKYLTQMNYVTSEVKSLKILYQNNILSIDDIDSLLYYSQNRSSYHDISNVPESKYLKQKLSNRKKEELVKNKSSNNDNNSMDNSSNNQNNINNMSFMDGLNVGLNKMRETVSDIVNYRNNNNDNNGNNENNNMNNHRSLFSKNDNNWKKKKFFSRYHRTNVNGNNGNNNNNNSMSNQQPSNFNRNKKKKSKRRKARQKRKQNNNNNDNTNDNINQNNDNMVNNGSTGIKILPRNRSQATREPETVAINVRSDQHGYKHERNKEGTRKRKRSASPIVRRIRHKQSGVTSDEGNDSLAITVYYYSYIFFYYACVWLLSDILCSDTYSVIYDMMHNICLCFVDTYITHNRHTYQTKKHQQRKELSSQVKKKLMEPSLRTKNSLSLILYMCVAMLLYVRVCYLVKVAIAPSFNFFCNILSLYYLFIGLAIVCEVLFLNLWDFFKFQFSPHFKNCIRHTIPVILHCCPSFSNHLSFSSTPILTSMQYVHVPYYEPIVDPTELTGSELEATGNNSESMRLIKTQIVRKRRSVRKKNRKKCSETASFDIGNVKPNAKQNDNKTHLFHLHGINKTSNDKPSKNKKLLPYQRHERKLRYISAVVQLGKHAGKYTKVSMMADSGADTSGINSAYAKRHFRKYVEKCETLIDTAGSTVKCKECIHFYFVDPENPKIILSEEYFYLIPNLGHDMIASGGLVEDLGHSPFVKRPTDLFVHKSEPDESFGSCNNWDTSDINVHCDNTVQYNEQLEHILDKKMQYMTPYDRQLYFCEKYLPSGTQNRTITSIVVNNKSHKIEPKEIYHISNFNASKEELDKVKQLTKDKPLGKVKLDYLIKSRSRWLHDQMQNLCDEFTDVFAKTQFQHKTIPNKQFSIDLKPGSKGLKIHKSQYHLNEEKRLVYLYHTMKNVENGLYEKVGYSPHNVPVIIVPRKDGRLRLAYDLTRLNDHTVDVKSHIPTYNWLFEQFRGKGLKTIADVKNFFENILLRKEDRDLCAITTPVGRYRLTHASYGFKNISTVAQEISNELMHPLGKSGAFIDDLFMNHEPNVSDKELLAQARKFLQRCRDMGILLHPEKTFFFVDEVEFLGYVFNKHGTRPTRKYIDKILKVPKPKGNGIGKQILSYVGLLQYIARYIDHMSEWTYWLTMLTRKENGRMKWGPEQDYAWQQLQKRVKNIKLLAHPNDKGEFLVQCDASNHAIGAVLYQRQYDKKLKRKQWKIIEFYSKQLDPRLLKYHPSIKECIALAYSLNHWKHFLLRKKFFVDSDNKAVVSLYEKSDDNAPNMRKQQVFNTLRMATAQFNFELCHLAGKDNILADYLSRDGSEANSVDGDSSHVVDCDTQLIGIDPDSAEDKQNVLHALSMLRQDREQFFEIGKTSDVIGTITSMSDLNQLSQKNQLPISMLHFDLEYLKEFGYVTPRAKRSTITFKDKVKTDTKLFKHDDPPCTGNLSKLDTNLIPSNSILKNPNCVSCAKPSICNNVKFKDTLKNDVVSFKQEDPPCNVRLAAQNTRSAPSKSALKNKYNVVKPSDIALSKQGSPPQASSKDDKIASNLATAIVNTIENCKLNTSSPNDDPISETISCLSLQNHQLYNKSYNHNNAVDNNDKLNFIIDKQITSQTIYHFTNQFMSYILDSDNTDSYIVNNNLYAGKKAPNYRQNDQFNRRGSRKRKKKLQHWEIPIFQGHDSNYDDDGNYVDNNIPNPFDNNEFEDDVPKADQHQISFPYNIGLKLAQSLYNRLFMPERYKDVISNDNFRKVQFGDDICRHVRRFILHDKQDSLEYLENEYPEIAKFVKNDEMLFKDDLLYVKSNDKYNDRLYVPCGLIHAILHIEHCINNIKHPGITQLTRQLATKYYWLHMSKDIESYVQQCTVCQKGKGSKHHKVGKLSPIKSKYPGEVVHFDFAGPFFKRLHILIMVDNYSGAVVLHPCYSQSSENVVMALLHKWYPYHGLPKMLITDRGSGFISKANKIIYRALGIHKIFTSAYHPQTNAKAERIVQEVKKALAMANITLDDSFTDTDTDNANEVDQTVKEIMLLLPAIQFSINQMVHTATQVSPNMLIYGRNLRDIVDFKLARKMLDKLPNKYDDLTKFEIVQQIKAMISQAQKRRDENHSKYVIVMKNNYDYDKVPHTFKKGDTVAYYVGDLPRTNKKLHQRFVGPCKITEILKGRNGNVVRIKILGTNYELACHAGMLKHYYDGGFTPLLEIRKTDKAIAKTKKEQKKKSKAKQPVAQSAPQHRYHLRSRKSKRKQ